MPPGVSLSPYLQPAVVSGKAYSGTYKSSRVQEEREYARMLSAALMEQGQQLGGGGGGGKTGDHCGRVHSQEYGRPFTLKLVTLVEIGGSSNYTNGSLVSEVPFVPYTPLTSAAARRFLF